MNKEAANSPEMLTVAYEPTRCYNVAYQTLKPYRCEIIKSYISNTGMALNTTIRDVQ